MIKLIVNHASGRMQGVFSKPSSVATFLLAVVISTLFWPSLTPTGIAPWGLEVQGSEMEMVSLAVIGVLWIGFFPMLLSLIVKPVSVGSSRSSSIELGHPALPIPIRARVITEALTVLVMIGVIRIPFVLLRDQLVGRGIYPENIAGSFPLGALVLLPALIVLLGRSSCLEHLFLGATIVGALICGSMPLGLMSTPARLTGLIAVLSAVAIWYAGRPPVSLSSMPVLFQSKRLARPSMPPVARLRLDFALRPLTALVPFVLAAGLLMFLRARGTIDATGMYLGSTFVFSLGIGFLVLRPMGSAQAIAGVWGKAGYAPGDFARSFSVLPVPRALVLRTIYLHGFITGALMWLGIILVGAFNARVAFGEALFFTDSKGRLIAEIVIPMLAMVPCAAGFLVEGAVGDKKMAFFTGALLFVAPQLVMIMLVLGAQPVVAAVVMLGVAIVGGTPALRHFNAVPEVA